MCFLTTRGRLTGASHTVPLLYGREGTSLVVAESNWGQRLRPSWALNLDAEPEVTVLVDGQDRRMIARRGSAEEADRWWPVLLGIWPGWEGYRERAGREIGLYVLEAATDRGDGGG